MGKAKTSRKGKKAWRKNIDSGEHDALVEKTAKEARIGGPLDQLPDAALFFVDKDKGGQRRNPIAILISALVAI